MTKPRVQFPDRHVLGEGYPVRMGDRTGLYGIYLDKNPTGINPVFLDFPYKLGEKDVPKYRLVLEKVKEDLCVQE